MQRFWKSNHRGVYLKLGLKYWCSPEKIYNLAHGHRSHLPDKKKKLLRQELMNHHIIFHLKPKK